MLSLLKFNYFELIFYIVGESLLQTSAGISKWNNFISKWRNNCKLGQALSKVMTPLCPILVQQLLQSGAGNSLQFGVVSAAKWGKTTKRGNFITKWSSY